MTTMETVATKHKGNAKSEPQTTIAPTPKPTETALEIFSYEGDEGGGFERQTMADRKLPLIVILQANSPQVAESRGAIKPGQIFNTVTGEALDEITFVPAITDRCWLQYIPRDPDGGGGGFRGRHPYESPLAADAVKKNGGRAFGKIPLQVKGKDPKTGKEVDEMHELVESFEVYAITYAGADPTGFAVISFTSTKIKNYKAWNTQLAHYAPKLGERQFKLGEIPLFAHRVKMTTELDQRGKLSWFIPTLSPAMGGNELSKSLLRKDDPRYVMARKLRDDVQKGLAHAAYETTSQDAPAAAGQVDDDAIPF
jgi:hypothetical protein